MMIVHVREATRCKRGFRNAQSTPARSNCARPFQRAKLNCKRTSGRACIYPNHHCFFVSSKDHAPRSRFLYTHHGPMPLTSPHQPRAHIHTHTRLPSSDIHDANGTRWLVHTLRQSSIRGTAPSRRSNHFLAYRSIYSAWLGTYMHCKWADAGVAYGCRRLADAALILHAHHHAQ